MWISNLKIAVIEKNADALNRLMDDVPNLKDEKEIEEAIYLLKEAIALINSLKDDTSVSMKLIKKNLDFLRSSDGLQHSNLDIKS
jgi:hypothetical protein